MNADKAISSVAFVNKPTVVSDVPVDGPAKVIKSNTTLVDSMSSGSVDSAAKMRPVQSSTGRLGILKNHLEEEECYPAVEPIDMGVFAYDEKEFSQGGAVAISYVKQRLTKLMGTDTIRILDKGYVEKLGYKLQTEYERAMKKKEKKRAEAEAIRTFRLSTDSISSCSSSANSGYNNNNIGSSTGYYF